ncbi:hypothetical protein V8E55_010362 [Tylopilus felleus]
MRTSTPLVHVSSPSTRKPAFKRRRLNNAIDPGCQPSRALTDNSNVAPTPNALPSAVYAKLSCSTCHRALSTAIRPGVAGHSICSRCSAPTCAICARTCTSYTRPSSFPPTPALTRSPSPSTHGNTPVSPKRTALSLSYATMNCDASVALPPPSVPSIKRKKALIEKEDVNGDGDLDSTTGRDHHDVMSIHNGGTDAIVIPGCGRVVCRACCIESPNDGKLCVDCFAFV